MNYYVEVLKKYAVFSGRAQRAEYWYFCLFNILISLGLNILGAVIGDAVAALGSLYTLAVFLPGLAVSVRRLHDTGRSGWMILVGLIPIIGFIWLLILMVQDSTPGAEPVRTKPERSSSPAVEHCIPNRLSMK